MFAADVKLCPVGGVNLGNMGDWWGAGASGFGIGSGLYKPGMPAAEIGRLAAQYVAALTELRTGA